MHEEIKKMEAFATISENHSSAIIELADRCSKIEQHVTGAGPGSFESKGGAFDLGNAIVTSTAFKEFASGAREKCRLELKTAIINQQPPNSSQPLVQGDRQAGIVVGAERVLRMRDLLTTMRTGSNLIEFAKENVYTNNAGPTISGSPEQVENVTKPESAISFTLSTEPVRTLAHSVPVSKQLMSDSPAFAEYVGARLLYGLKLKEDSQILVGSGINGQLQGLYTNRTVYSVPSPTLYTTKLDVLRDAIAQCQSNDFAPTGIVLNSADWAKIELAKDSQQRYLAGVPQNALTPRLWGLPVIVTNSMTAGTFLVGAFDQAAALWDRWDATIEIGLVNDQFTKNMLTVLAEERVAVTIFRPKALIGGSFIA